MNIKDFFLYTIFLPDFSFLLRTLGGYAGNSLVYILYYIILYLLHNITNRPRDHGDVQNLNVSLTIIETGI